LLNPTTNNHSFGEIVEMSGRGWHLPAGIIVLKSGRHKGPHRGFGAAHIMAEHVKEMAVAGHSTAEDYVAWIIQPGTPIYCEFDRMRGGQRVAVVRSRGGKVILEVDRNELGQPYYSVITAYSDTKAHGTRVGTVR
tara:strand:+ start:79 stop:486 length:408 start_codon:yes stop_codon:yes gene_type:complete